MAHDGKGLVDRTHGVVGIGNVAAKDAEIFFHFGIVFLDGAQELEDLAGFGFQFFTLKGLEENLEVGVESVGGNWVNAGVSGGHT